MTAIPDRRIRVMLAASDPGFLYRLVGRVASGKDMMVEASAHTWRDAAKQFMISQPDVAVLELRMPGVPQIKVMRKARPQARLIVLTGTEDAGLDVRQELGPGVQGMVRKNAPRKRLLQCIRTVYKGGTCLPRRKEK